MTFQKLKEMMTDHLLIQHNLTFYPYQQEVSERILIALLNNLEVKTEADVEQLQLIELPIEFSRQAGKTTAVTHTVEFIMTFVSELYDMPINIGLFAPQIEQAKTDFERLKTALRPIKGLMVQDDEEKQRIREQENAKTLVLPNGSSCWIAPVTTTSKPESKTFHLMIFEEAQDIDDKILKERIWPIGSTTNAPRIYIGTAGTHICHFYRLGQSGQALRLYYHDIVKQRRHVYEQTKDIRHLIYERTVAQEIEKHGLESDEIQRPYFGKWLIGAGQFITQEGLDELVDTERGLTWQETKSDSYAGIDVAKYPDSTVVTILRWNKDKKIKEVINWLELRGDNYQDQFDIIHEFLKRYTIRAVAIDSTGQGDFMPDLFEKHTVWQDEDTGLYRVKFSAVSKDAIYKNLKVSIRELLTRLPRLDIKDGERFKQQMLDLQQEYKGQLLHVQHPDDDKAHDDYPDSWALAEWAFARFNEDKPEVHFVEQATKPERHVVKDDENKVTDYWPGADW